MNYGSLKMPHHKVKWRHGGGVCTSTALPGFAQRLGDGRLYCKMCGWKTREPVVAFYSAKTRGFYLTMDDLVYAEEAARIFDQKEETR